MHDTIGFDLVGMLVDDLVVCGAEPLFLTDYIATGRVVPERIAAIVQGHRRGLRAAPAARWSAARPPSTPGCSAPTSTTSRARPPASWRPADLLGPGRVRPGDVVVAMASSGLHSNGYSLVRHVLLGTEGGAGWQLDRHVDELGRTLGEELLEPTRIYAKACLDLARSTATHAMSHVTGGGLAANLERVHAGHRAWPRSTAARWTPQPVFDLVRRVGAVARADLERTLNCGVGMVAADRRRGRRPGRRAARGPRHRRRGSRRGHRGRRRRSPAAAVALTGSHPGWT